MMEKKWLDLYLQEMWYVKKSFMKSIVQSSHLIGMQNIFFEI